MTIDWTKPLEAQDGTPLVLCQHGEETGDNTNPDRDGDYWVMKEGDVESGATAYCVDPKNEESHYILGILRNRGAVT